MTKVSVQKRPGLVRRAISRVLRRLVRWLSPVDDPVRIRLEMKGKLRRVETRMKEQGSRLRALERYKAMMDTYFFELDEMVATTPPRPGGRRPKSIRSGHSERRRLRRELGLALQQTTFIDRIDDEPALTAALVTFARSSTHPDFQARTRSLLAWLAERGGTTAEPARTALGVVSWIAGAETFAWEHFVRCDARRCARFAAAEYFTVAFRRDRPAARSVAQELLEHPSDLGAATWLALFEASFGAGDLDIAKRALATAEKCVATKAEISPEMQRRLSWYRSWLDRLSQPPPTVVPGALHFATLSYRHPDLLASTKNLGDYTQTLAGLSHVLRHRNLRFVGEREVVSLASDLQRRVRKELLLDTPARDVQVHVVHRDASNLDVVPEGTWLLVFGWYMKESFAQRFDFPFNPNLRPIFVSFHVNRPGMLSPEGLDYLRRNGPVGCRDWATTYLLLSAGVDAFFSGCMTTTLDAYFERPYESHGTGRTLYVDALGAQDKPHVFAQEQEPIRTRSFDENMRDALAKLDWYRAEFDQIVTSRLHSYLPARTMGMPVEFRARNPADVRFEGLIGIDDESLEAMRSGIRAKLEAVTTAIFRGESEAEVRSLWARLCVADVEHAKDRLREVPALGTQLDMGQIVASVRETRRDRPRIGAAESGAPEVHIEVSLDGNLKHQLEVVLDSVVAHTKAPLHFYVLARDLTSADKERVEHLFPELTFSWFSFDNVSYGGIRLIRHITVATMDRLLLPDLLPELPRIIHLDLDLIVEGDVAELFAVDLQGMPLAARTSPLEKSSSGIETLLRNVKHLGSDLPRARGFLQRTLARQKFDFDAFNAGVLVLDLECMRRERFCTDIVPCAVEFGLHDQDLLNFYVGPRRAHLDRKWNVLPRVEHVTSPAIVHWAGSEKPWSADYVAAKALWNDGEARLRIRQAQRITAG